MLVLDDWDGLDDDMFQDLMQSLSSSTSLRNISIKGSSWEKEGKGERLAKALRDRKEKPLSSQVLALVAELEPESSSLQQLPSVDVWGSYFDCECQDGECEHRGEWEVRMRLLTAIGKCRSLRKIQLNPKRMAGYSVREVEALALFSGLQDNSALVELDLFSYQGFGTTAACVQALTAVIQRCYRSLEVLDLQYVGLSAEGVGDIAAALGRNASSVLSTLTLDGSDIGSAVGAQQLAHILTNSPSLRFLGMSNVGMEEEGAVVIADALAKHTTTLTSLRIGDRIQKQPTAPKFVIPLLQALVWPDESSQQSPASASGHFSSGPIYLKEEDDDDDLDCYDFWSGLRKWSEKSKNYFLDPTTTMFSTASHSSERGVTTRLLPPGSKSSACF